MFGSSDLTFIGVLNVWIIKTGDQSSGISSSSLAAVSGYASITVPAGEVVGLPIGLSFIGGEFSDAKLIQFAYTFEQASQARKPPLVD